MIIAEDDTTAVRFNIRSSIPGKVRRDFTGMIEEYLDNLSRQNGPYGLCVTFSRSSDPTRPEGVPPVIETVNSTADITHRLWQSADMIEARITPQQTGDSVTLSCNRLADARRIDIEVRYAPPAP